MTKLSVSYVCWLFSFLLAIRKCDYCLIWTQKKHVVSFGKDLVKLSLFFDMKLEKVFTIIDNNCLKGNTFFIYLVKCFITICFKGFHVFKFSD